MRLPALSLCSGDDAILFWGRTGNSEEIVRYGGVKNNLYYFIEGITSGFVEGLNDALRAMVRIAFGYRIFVNSDSWHSLCLWIFTPIRHEPVLSWSWLAMSWQRHPPIAFQTEPGSVLAFSGIGNCMVCHAGTELATGSQAVAALNANEA